MPELPEVETVRAGLARLLLGWRIDDVAVMRERTVRRQEGGAAEFAARVSGRRIEEVARRGKFLWLPLDSGEALVAHLGMSGQFRWHPLRESDAAVPHARVRFAASRGPERGTLTFADQRTFGYLLAAPLLPTADQLPGGEGTNQAAIPATAAHIARDLLDPFIDLRALSAAIGRSSRPIKAALLDQSLVSGIGNIYADEALWRAAVNGSQPASLVGPRRRMRLLLAAREVMGEALEAGGTSFDALYVSVNGESGYFSRQLDVYGREGEPCARCGTPIRRVPFAGRSSHFCPRCQRPR